MQLRLCRTPVALTRLVKARLVELEQQDIVEQVSEPSKWVSALVAVLKNNIEIRLCVDLRHSLMDLRLFLLLDIKAAYA